MYNGKMCVGIFKGDLMCRIDPALHEKAIAKKGCRTMDFTNRPMSGYIMIDDTGMKSKKDFATGLIWLWILTKKQNLPGKEKNKNRCRHLLKIHAANAFFACK